MPTKTLTSLAAVIALTFVPATIAFADETAADPAATVLEAATATIDLELGTLAETLTAEIALAIENNVISAETVNAVLAAGEAATQEIADANLDSWTAEEPVWIEAEQTVAAAVTCDINDPTCAADVGATVQVLATEKLLATIQARIDEVLALPESERARELQDLGEDVSKLRARLNGTASSDDDDDDDLYELRSGARERSSGYDDDIEERLAEVLFGDDDFLDGGDEDCDGASASGTNTCDDDDRDEYRDNDDDDDEDRSSGSNSRDDDRSDSSNNRFDDDDDDDLDEKDSDRSSSTADTTRDGDDDDDESREDSRSESREDRSNDDSDDDDDDD